VEVLMDVGAGELRHRLRFEQLTAVTDSSGHPIQDPETGKKQQAWTLFANRWARIRFLKGRELLLAQQINSKVTAEITVRFVPGLTSKMRIVHGSTYFNIEGVLPDDDSGIEWHVLPCSTGLNQG
jgi:SPP1 family predicted phage head-tail adaptor